MLNDINPVVLAVTWLNRRAVVNLLFLIVLVVITQSTAASSSFTSPSHLVGPARYPASNAIDRKLRNPPISRHLLRSQRAALQPGSGVVRPFSNLAEAGFGDRIYMVQPGDSLKSIARNLTGNQGNWKAIGRYNQLTRADELKVGQVLLIPAESLKRVATQYKQAGTAPSIPQSPSDGRSAPIEEPSLGSAGSETVVTDASSVETHKVDMFVGEVRVLDNVEVTRVAVGNGSIVRAEVLATGELLAIAQEPGSSSLHLWHKGGRQSDYNIRVSATDPEVRVRLEKMVKMRVKMVEFRKSALNRLGIDWGDSMAGPIFATAGDAISNPLFRPVNEAIDQALPNRVEPFSSYFGIASRLSSRINLMVNSGDAVMLAEPVLSCRNGASARFLAGGEVPYTSVNANGQTTVEFKEYGIRLEVSPVVDNAGVVQASVMTEISAIDPAVTVQGAPGLLTRRSETQVSVAAGNTIVIAGLLSADSSKDIDRLPGVGKLPIFGKLFGSENVRNNLSELVIFITPEVIDPATQTLSMRENQVHTMSAAKLEQSAQQLNVEFTD